MTMWNNGRVHDLLEPGSPQERLGTRLLHMCAWDTELYCQMDLNKQPSNSNIANQLNSISKFMDKHALTGNNRKLTHGMPALYFCLTYYIHVYLNQNFLYVKTDINMRRL